MNPDPCLFRIRISRNLPGFHFIHKEPGKFAEIYCVQSFIVRRWIQDDRHFSLISGFHDQRQLIDFILKDQYISFAETRKSLRHLLFCDASVGSAKQQNTVFSTCIYLNHCVALQFLRWHEIRRIHTIFPEDLDQSFSSPADTAGMKHIRSRSGQCAGLIQTFSARIDLLCFGAHGFAGLYKVINTVYVIQIQ